VDKTIGTSVHVASARQCPDTSKEGAIDDSERLFLKEIWRSAVLGLMWVLCFKMALNCEHSCTRQSLMECHVNEISCKDWKFLLDDWSQQYVTKCTPRGLAQWQDGLPQRV